MAGLWGFKPEGQFSRGFGAGAPSHRRCDIRGVLYIPRRCDRTWVLRGQGGSLCDLRLPGALVA